MKELEDKVVLDVQYDFNKDEENEAFMKLRIAAKAYDRSHPASLGHTLADLPHLSSPVAPSNLLPPLTSPLTPSNFPLTLYYPL